MKGKFRKERKTTTPKEKTRKKKRKGNVNHRLTPLPHKFQIPKLLMHHLIRVWRAVIGGKGSIPGLSKERRKGAQGLMVDW